MPVPAFKEWAAVCHALAAGRQSLILRKGGIAEESGEFRPEHPRFLLYPTYFHEQQQAGLQAEGLTWLQAAETERPPAGQLHFTHAAEVAAVYHARELAPLLALDRLHIWSEQTVRQRFAYRTPGLFVLVVRVLALPKPCVRPERPAYAGCKTWVMLEEIPYDIPSDWAGDPVLAADQFESVVATVSACFQSSSRCPREAG